MQYPHLLQCTATRWRFRFNKKKGKAYAWWYKYFYATLWVSLECSKPDVVQARPGQARAGQERTGEARPCQSRSMQTKRQPLTLWPSIGISLLRVSLTVRVSICMHTYTCVYVCAHGPLYCQAAVQSLIMLMDIRFDLAELTRHMLLPLLFFFFFRAGQSHTNELPFDVTHPYIHIYCVCGMPSHISELISLSVPPLHGFFLLVTLEFFCMCLSCGL